MVESEPEKKPVENEKPAEAAPEPEVAKESKEPKTQPHYAKRVVSTLVVVALCFVAGFGGVELANRVNTIQSSTAEFQKVTNDGNLSVTPTEQTISKVVDKVSPSVVSIVTTSSSNRSGYETVAAGTGMIISADGYVMTNKHVVGNSKTVSVITVGGTTYKDVPVLGTDPLNDVAFLKIKDVSDLPPVSLGDSKTVRTGQSVIAIGNALGQYQNTVTSGIISGLGRPVTASEDGTSTTNAESLSDLLQTDAAINSGNSGGPLLNLEGQVVGMNTAVAQDAQSIGFAIPIGAAKGLIAHVIKTGKVQRAVIGLQYISITPELKEEKKLQVNQGDYVQAVSGKGIQSNSPAQQAGIKAGDIILKVNNQDVGPGKSIATLVGEFQPGDTVQLTLLRDGKTMTKDLTLAAY